MVMSCCFPAQHRRRCRYMVWRCRAWLWTTRSSRRHFGRVLRFAAAKRGRTVGAWEQGRRVLELAEGGRVRTGFVIGADGAHTTIGELGRLVAADEVIWAFALRYYVEAKVDLPTIVC